MEKFEPGIDQETKDLIERLKSMAPKVPEKDIAISLKPKETSILKKPKSSWTSFAERSLPNGDRD